MISLARRLAIAQEVAELFADEREPDAVDAVRAGLAIYRTADAKQEAISRARAARRAANTCVDCGVSLAHRAGQTRRCDRHAREHALQYFRERAKLAAPPRCCRSCSAPLSGRGMTLYCDAHRPARKASRTCITCATPIVGARGPAKFCARCRPVRSSVVYRRAFA